jgi:hypothetical protein
MRPPRSPSATSCRCALATSAALIALSSSALAQSITISVDTFKLSARGRAEAVVRVVNGTAKRYDTIMLNCAFLQDGKAVATAQGVINNLDAGETAFTTVTSDTKATEARCRAGAML